MDWTLFWTAVGAVGAVALVALRAILYGRTKARVVVESIQQEYSLPPSLVAIFRQLRRVDSISLPTDFLESTHPRFREFWKAVTDVRDNSKLMDFAQYQQTNRMLIFNVTNRGHERAEQIELQVPGAVESVLVLSDESMELIPGGIIRIPELRPGESVKIVSWATRPGIHGPRLLQAKGKAIMRLQELVPSRVASFYKMAREPIFVWTTIVFVMLLVLAFTSLIRIRY